MRIQVLGPVCVWRDGEPLDLGPAAQRAVLGLLTLARGQPLPRAEIMSGIWYESEPPPTAANVIQTYVKRLRRTLEPDRRPRAPSTVLRQVGDGYALHVPAVAVDVTQFRQRILAAAGWQRRGELDSAAELLKEALDLWRGPPLADLPALASHPKVVALAAERQAALGRYGEVLIAVGRAADGLPALEEAAATQPMDEAGQARLVRAYHAAGRRGQAFDTYHEARRRLADELGVAPGPELSAAHATLFRDEGPDPRHPAPAVPGPEPAARPAARVPAQLPADLPEFAGRAAELFRLDRLLDAAHRSADASPVVVCAVSGAAGVGKTALAVRWAHRVAPRFPDGQLYVNLRGFDAAGVVMDPAEAVRRFLDALDVPAERIPPDLDAQAALYRSQVAGRRMLVLLDNARDAAQVRPLLPGGPGCLVVVTSRNQLSSLVAAEGAHPLPVDPLTADEARDLLVRRLGAERTDGQPRAVAEILNRCAGLPLALAIVAARAVINRKLPLTALADQLGRTRRRLDALTTGDPSTDLRAVLSWSYHALAPQPARLFRLLGLHPGPDISVPAAASLAALPEPRVREVLAELAGASLVVEHRPDRYTLHDLLRAYAGDLTERIDRGGRRRTATLRMLDHYLHSAHAADRSLGPTQQAIPLGPPATGVVPERPADHQQALAWFTAEHAVLLAAVDRAAVVSGAHVWRLAWTLATYLDRQGHWDDLAATQLAAVAAARQQADPPAQAGAHRCLARAFTRLGRLDDAHTQLRHALDLYRHTGDQSGQGHTHLNMALVWDRRDRHAEALEHARQSLALFRTTGDRHGQARAHNTIGWHHAVLGDHRQALNYCRLALAQLRELDDRSGQATTWDSLGYTHHHLGHHIRAVGCYQQALDLFHRLGDRHLGAIVLAHLADTYQTLGRTRAARDAWQEALAILDDVDHPEAEKVRGKLARLAATSPAWELDRDFAPVEV